MIYYDLHDMSTSCASGLIIEAPLANHQICPRVLVFGEPAGADLGMFASKWPLKYGKIWGKYGKIWENLGKYGENDEKMDFFSAQEIGTWLCFLTHQLQRESLCWYSGLHGKDDGKKSSLDTKKTGPMLRGISPRVAEVLLLGQTVDNHDNENSLAFEQRKQYCVGTKLQQSTLSCMVLPC